jgi:hypothetical protein
MSDYLRDIEWNDFLRAQSRGEEYKPDKYDPDMRTPSEWNDYSSRRPSP